MNRTGVLRVAAAVTVFAAGACSGSGEEASGARASETTAASEVTEETATTAPAIASPAGGQTLAELLAGSSLEDAGCVEGEETCVAAVVEEMSRRLEALLATCDHNAVFALTYFRLTESLLDAIETAGFDDPQWLRRLDAAFAQLYFNARDAWTSGRRDEVARPWRDAFSASDASLLSGIGDLFLHTNAHITHDLPIVLAMIGVDDSRDADYSMVNEFINGAAPIVTQDVATRLDPAIADFSIPALDVDETTVGILFSTWRADSLVQGKRLAGAATPDEYDAILEQIVASTTARALVIQAATGYVPFVTGPEVRDAHCAAA